MAVSVRPAQADDEEFLYTLYALSRRDEMAAWGWPDAQQQMFLRLQFTARQAHYRDQFPHADHQIILLDEAPVGRIVVVRNEDHFRLADIVLLPEHRGSGIGSSLINDLLDEAQKAEKPVQLFVEKFNPAIRLYERLGFRIVGDIDSHFSMQWTPDR
jgi:ribosomal protein S18 acetylase RimI-like enzyme